MRVLIAPQGFKGTLTGPRAAEAIAEGMDVPVVAMEVHPTHDRLEVGMVHLNDHR